MLTLIADSVVCFFRRLTHFYLVDPTWDNCSCKQRTNQITRLPVAPRHLVVLALLSVPADPRLLTFLSPHPYLSHPGQNLLLAVSPRLLVSDHYRGCQSPWQPSSFGLRPPPELSSASPDCSISPQSHCPVPVFPRSELLPVFFYRNTCGHFVSVVTVLGIKTCL